MRTAQYILLFPLQMLNGLPDSKLHTPASGSMNDDYDDDDDKDSSRSKKFAYEYKQCE